jgi:23S rRNA pseudouridine2605 synthase
MRIARFLARAGVASRREAEGIVTAGRVCINGAPSTELWRRIDPATDLVTLDGAPIRLAAQHLTLVYNKPSGCLTSRHDERGRPTIYDHLPTSFATRRRELAYAGRLDYRTRGLLVLSTDGDLINDLTHPSKNIAKVYLVQVDRPLAPRALNRLEEGVMLEDGMARAQRATFCTPADRSIVETVIGEGRNRQVRRMFEAVGAVVVDLVRVAVGGLRLDKLALEEGSWKEMEGDEVRRLIVGD